jgi:hypothetical protein
VRFTISRFAASAVIAGSLLAAGQDAGLAECASNIELVSAISGDSLTGRWSETDSTETWVALLRIEVDGWKPASGMERHCYRAQPLAVLKGGLPAKPLWLTTGVVRNLAKGTLVHMGETFEPAVGDTVVLASTWRLGETGPGMAYMSLCTTVRVQDGHVMGVPLVTILERPGVAKGDSLPSGQYR